MRVLPKTPWLPITMLVVSLLGFADATYLTVTHVTGTTVPCGITHGCDVVTTSVYSEILGVPVALLGALFYLAVFGLLFVAIDKANAKLLLLAGRMTLAGFLFSLWFLFVQAFLLRAFCQWCIGSAISSTLLFIFGFIVLPRVLKKETPILHDVGQA